MSSRDVTCWFTARTDTELAAAIERHVEDLRDKQSAQRKIDEIHGVLYANKYRHSGVAAGALAVLQAGGRQPLKLNVIRSMIETVTARIAQNFPLVQVAADGAEWSYKLKARRMTRFITTKQEETGFRRLAPMVFRDACVRGTGIIKVTSRSGELVHDRVPKRELFVDELESRYGEARNVHREMSYSRDVLAAMFPRHRSAIMDGSNDDDERDDDPTELRGYDRSNLVRVTESHHLPSGPDEDDGLHAISIHGRVLYRGEWKRSRLPYSFFHWSPPDEGFWGTGLAEELAPIQWAIDQTVGVLNEGFRLGAPLKVFVNRRSKVVATHLVPMVGAIVEFDGALPPEIRAPSNPVSQQQIQWLLQLFEWAYQISGISQMAAAGKKPGSLESGEALRVFHDFETERFQHVENQYQNLALDSAERQIDEAKDIYGSKSKDGEPLHRDFHAKWINRDVVEKIPWGQVDLQRDCFKLKLKPVNALTGSMAGKVDRAKFFVDGGLVPAQQILALFDNPDLERFTRLQTALFNYAEWTVEQLMDEDRPMPQPSSVADLAFLEEHVKAGWLDAISDGAPPKVEGRFASYTTILRAKMAKASAAVAAPAAAMGMGMPPMGAGPGGPGGPLLPAPAPTSMEGAALPNAPMAAVA